MFIYFMVSRQTTLYYVLCRENNAIECAIGRLISPSNQELHFTFGPKDIVLHRCFKIHLKNPKASVNFYISS